jgi:hypothetical protein
MVTVETTLHKLAAGKSLLTSFSLPTLVQVPTEDFQQRLLAFENTLLRFCYRKPTAPIDFGDLNQTLRPGWPFYLTQIAFQVAGIAVSLKGPCCDGLSARLLDHAQVKKYSFGCESCLFLEFTAGGIQSVFTFG